MADKNQGFSDRLKRLIGKQGLSQKSLAERVGVTPSGMNKYTSKGGVPEWHILIKIAQAFNVSTDWLLTGERSGGAAALYLPLWNGEAQETACVSQEWLDELGVAVADARLIKCPDAGVPQRRGLRRDDLAVLDVSAQTYTDRGVYALLLPDHAEPVLRALDRSDGMIWVEPSPLGPEHLLPPKAAIVGLVVGRRGPV